MAACVGEFDRALLSDARRLQSATISARRLFAYLGVSDTPMAGFDDDYVQ